MQAFIMAHHTRPKVIKPCDDRQYDDPRKECYFICNCRKCRMDGSFEPVNFIIVVHNTLWQAEIWRLILQTECSDKFARKIFVISSECDYPSGVVVIGLVNGMYVVV